MPDAKILRDALPAADPEAAGDGPAAGHRLTVRVYYEDTDLAGIVYYANYLRFIERARSEWLRELGIDQAALKRDGLVFAVRRIAADYLSPARFDDLLTIETLPLAVSPARLVLSQAALRGAAPLFRAEVTLVAIGPRGRAARLPAAVLSGAATALGQTPPIPG